jgi:DNA processing protein
LKNIFNPPLVIFVLGNLKPLNEKICINVIGKRKASSYALHAATAICEPLAKIGTVIISGFALGIDVAAMSAALNAGGITAGVLACGIDVDYPRGSMSFRSDVANSGGAVITECLPGTRAGRQAFQIRNRLMSGLAQGTLVIEAGEQSGCHITAEHTLNQNRDLFCVPPCDIFDPEVTGTVRYLRDGAVPVFDYTDIVNAYQMYYGQMLVEYAADDNRKKEDPTAVAGTYPEKSDPTTRFPGNIDSVEIITPKNPVRPEVEPEKIPAKRISEVMAVLSEDCKKIYDFLQIERTAAIDDITAKTELPADAVNAALLDLEIEGLVEPLGGTRYKIID